LPHTSLDNLVVPQDLLNKAENPHAISQQCIASNTVDEDAGNFCQTLAASLASSNSNSAIGGANQALDLFSEGHTQWTLFAPQQST
jgi:hypothetical protein